MLIGVIIIQELVFLRNNLTTKHTHTLNYTLSPSSNAVLGNVKFITLGTKVPHLNLKKN